MKYFIVNQYDKKWSTKTHFICSKDTRIAVRTRYLLQLVDKNGKVPINGGKGFKILNPDVWRIIFSFLIDGVQIPKGMLLFKKPMNVEIYTKIKKINISGQNIQFLPNSFNLLKNIEEIDLGRNKIKELPNSIFSLLHLQKFICAQNKLTSLPNLFGLLKKFKLYKFFC